MISPSELRAIHLNEEDKVKCLYQLMISGCMHHFPGNRYLVGQNHIDYLEKNKIPFSELSVKELMKELKIKIKSIQNRDSYSLSFI